MASRAKRAPRTALERLKRGRHICGDKCPEMPPALCMSCGIKRQVKRAVAAERRRVFNAIRLARHWTCSYDALEETILDARRELRLNDACEVRKGGRGER